MIKNTKLFPLLFTGLALCINMHAEKPKSNHILLVNDDAKTSIVINNAEAVKKAAPLQQLAIIGAAGQFVSVKDGVGKEYVRVPSAQVVNFTVGGSLGTHTIVVTDKKGAEISRSTFEVDAKTNVDDKGKYKELFDLLYKGMCVYSPDGTEKTTWNGKDYHYFVPWVLDNYETSLGMQYFSPYASDMVDMFRLVQREDGMIWSFVDKSEGPGYFDTAYGPFNYIKRDGKIFFVRQPVENHVEYLYVNLMYRACKANGNDQWMRENLTAAAKALDYCVNDDSRWSSKYKLLKRAYTIDSWDFQIEDSTSAKLGLNSSMLIDSKLTKFGVFYGDNTGYAEACDQVANMYEYNNQKTETNKYRQRANDVRQQLNKIAWNGRFFTHRVEEDETIKRNLGVDEKAQISQFNAYSINRGLPHDQNVAIIKTYLNLKDNLPIGGVNEWFAIYPPFERGFEKHNEKWQYMNGGIAGHLAGELARGSYENGYEDYGTDILNRLLVIGKKYGDKIWFAYTGAFPPPPVDPVYTPIDLSMQANMSILDKSSEKGIMGWMDGEQDNDLRNLPTGSQKFAGIDFKIASPQKNAVSVSSKKGRAKQATIPVNASGVTLYLLHATSKTGSENISASITFQYEDGTSKTQYLVNGKHVGGWWFPALKTENSGVAWRGTNPKSKDVGLTWVALANPSPEKKIKNLVLDATVDESTYILVAATLADKPFYIAPKGTSYGGPDNWAASTGMAGLVEGLVGVTDEKTAYKQVHLSPRWTSAGVNSVESIIRYAASKGYVAYRFNHDAANKQITLTTTGSGDKINCHLLLPKDVKNIQSVMIGDQKLPFDMSKVEQSNYVDFAIIQTTPMNVVVKY
jgi:hypothetical protein